MQTGECPICDLSSQLNQLDLDIYKIRCPRCGDYLINRSAKDAIKRAFELDKPGIDQYLSMGETADYPSANRPYIEVAKKAADGRGVGVARSIISHVLRKRMDKRAILIPEVLADVLKNNSLPNPAELANNFVSLLGENLSSPGNSFQVNPQQENIYGLIGFKIGTESKDLAFIVTSLEEKRIIDVTYAEGTSGGRKIPLKASLTLEGWQRNDELRRSVKDSRRAFIAMEFPSVAKSIGNYFFQNKLLDDYLIPAVKKTGFDLANALRTEPMAGNLHARLEVEIRKARFLVAELSHHNNGAYWEAGFARGLGKPVIYMYNKEVVKLDKPPHFDVASDHYIVWEENQPDKAADELRAVIRATLSAEAVMED